MVVGDGGLRISLNRVVGFTEFALTFTSSQDVSSQGAVLAAISDEMVRVYKEHFGRGPTKVRTNWAGSDTLITVLEDSLTPSERSLIRLGSEQELRNIRLLFQDAAEPEFRRIVEQATGRAVRSFVSGIDTAADVSVEVFVLELAARGSAEPQTTLSP